MAHVVENCPVYFMRAITQSTPAVAEPLTHLHWLNQYRYAAEQLKRLTATDNAQQDDNDRYHEEKMDKPSDGH